MKKNWWKILLVVALTALLLYLFFRSVDWNEVLASLIDVNVPLFILAVVLIPTHMLTRAIRWKYLLQHEKEERVFVQSFRRQCRWFYGDSDLPRQAG